MNTELKNAVLATDLKAQYDACAKKLLGYKDILARILIEAVEEFRGMSPEEVKPLIEDDIHIGKIPIDPGLTNKVVGVDENGKEIIKTLDSLFKQDDARKILGITDRW